MHGDDAEDAAEPELEKVCEYRNGGGEDSEVEEEEKEGMALPEGFFAVVHTAYQAG